MIEDFRNMRAMVRIEDEVIYLLFLQALPDKYNVFRQMLERERDKLTIDRLRTEYGPGMTPRLRLTLLFLFLERSGETA